MRTLLIDHYDSFTYNLVQLIGTLDEAPIVIRHDRLRVRDVIELQPARIVLSPGPGSPDDPRYFGAGAAIIRELGPRVPILGVCLGHQGIAVAYGGRVVRASQPMHGKSSVISHHGDPLFAGVPGRFEGMRYHSLVAERSSLPASLAVIAETDDGVIMAVRHVEHPTVGVQFHPESIGTAWGSRIVDNFLRQPR